MKKSRHYKRWHNWDHHPKVHFAIVVLFLVVFVGFNMRAFAIDTEYTWSFENPGDYTYDNNKIEPNNNNLKLSLRDAVKNFSVAEGQLQSDTVLDVAADNTYYYVSNSLGIDVIRQDTMERSAYITSGGGFPTIAVENGYLYAGKNGGIYRWQVSGLTNNSSLGSYRYTTSSTPALSNNDVQKLYTKYIGNKVYVAAVTPNFVHIIKDELGSTAIVKAYTTSVCTPTGVAISNDGALYFGCKQNGTEPAGAVFVKYNAINMTTDWAYNQNSVDYGQDWTSAHGPNPSRNTFLGLRVSDGTSTANAGDNTIYVETQDGLSVIQENRITPSSGTINNFTYTSRGSNLLSGSTSQSRFNVPSNPTSRTTDGNLGTYYLGPALASNDWIEYNLGSMQSANYFRHYLWNTSEYWPTSYVIESSTTGTTPNLSTSATAVGQWDLGTTYNPSRGIDDNTSTDYIASVSTDVIDQQLYEVRYSSPQEIGAVDMQFRESLRRGRDYVIEGSSASTSDPVVPISVTASSENGSGGLASRSYDGNTGTKWETTVAPTPSSPQWIRYDFGTSTTIGGLSFFTTDGLAQSVKAYTIQYSDDGNNWSTAYTQNNHTGRYVRASFNPVTARYIRLHVTETQIAGRIAIHEMQFFSSMFENGTVTQLAQVTNNSQLARLSAFNPTTVQSIRIRATAVGDTVNGLAVKDMRTHQRSFENGTVTQLANLTNVSLLAPSGYNVNHDMAFPSVSTQYIRVRHNPMPTGGMLITEAFLGNTSIPDWFPSVIRAGDINQSTGKYYALLNTPSPEEGRIVRVDGVQTNQLSVGEVINKSTKPDIANNEFTAMKIVDNNKMITGTSAGASFIGKRYSNDLPSIQPNTAFNPAAVASWKTFEESANKNGGEIYYQISTDNGDNWLYWNGSTWTTAGTSDKNTAQEINDHISDLPIGTREFTWKAYLESNGSQEVTLQNVTITINPDVNPPVTNANDIQMFDAPNGQEIQNNDWVTTNTPYFSWTEAEDDSNPGATGIKGYCLYLGQDENALPESDKGILGTSPIDTDNTCLYAVASNQLNLSIQNILNSNLTSSINPYFLKIKAIDQSNNLFTGDAEKFQFRFDNTVPTAPGFISAPSQFLATRDVTLTWPTTGDGAISDEHSGILGLQYRIGGEGTWYGSNHSGSQDRNDVLQNNGSYRTDETYDYPALIEGNNIIYFRTIDQAGNFSTTYATAVIKVNTAAPSSPRNVIADPGSNTSNSFAFSWDHPESFVGPSSALQYCYTVNTLPTSFTCNFTNAGATGIAAGPYATQPGENTFYVVAKDEAGNINYATYASATFQANTAAPGMPTNVEIADISTKSTSNWKIALSWAAPEDQGSGVANYKVYRATDNQNFSQIATTSGLSYVDSGIPQSRFYYKVKGCDSANNCGAFSSVTNMYPTGKFTEPAKLVAKPEISNITTKKARIKWSTNRESDSKVAIGKSRGNYFASEISNSSQVTNHILDLDNLDAGTTYYFVARWTDEDGNTGVSQEVSFSTAPAPFVREVKAVKVGLNNAIIQFTSNDATKAVINFGKTESLGGTVELNTSLSESKYNVELPGLDDGSKYFYRIVLLDTEGGEYPGDIYSFATPPRPRITEVRFQPVEDQPTSTQKISWKTNVPASSGLTYGIEGLAGRDLQDGKLKTEHEIIVKGLLDDSKYFVVAQSRDAGGNLAVSDRLTFKTALDTRPPKISDVTVETSIKGTGAEARGQVVVSWKTDEPSSSQVAYDEGSSTTEYNNKTSEDTALAIEHIVIISDLPTSRLYSVQPISKDKSANSGIGESKSAIIGRAPDSVITIVLNTLRKVFGF